MGLASSGSDRGAGDGVVVVGGGVSGCACAAILVSLGVAVTLVDPALDGLGRPSHGPVVVGASGVVGEDWLSELPVELRRAWEEGAMVSGDGSVVVVDRRLVGVRSKQTLEGMKGLQMRQGLVVGVGLTDNEDRVAGGGRAVVHVETAFGETFVGEAVVLAVGMGLRESAGGEGGEKGGYGRPLCRELEESLEALGAEFGEVVARVEPRFAAGGSGERVGEGPGLWHRWCEEQGGESARLTVVGLSRGGEESGPGREGAPPSPYEIEALWLREAVVRTEHGSEATVIAAADGVATGEVAVKALRHDEVATQEPGEWCRGEGPGLASRPGYVVHGLAVRNVDREGRLQGAGGGGVPIWVTGRAGGATGYVESLRGAVRIGRAVAEYVSSGGSRGAGSSGSVC